MTREQLSTVFNFLGGFLVYTLCLLAFVDIPTDISKPAVACIFGMPAVFFLAAAAAVNRFEHWEWRLGAVLLSSAGLTAIVAIAAALLLLSPEARALYRNSGVDFFSDYQTGAITTVAVALSGVLLMWHSTRKATKVRAVGDT